VSDGQRPFPHLRLRAPSAELLALPWDLPLADWSDEALQFRVLPVGPSRHLVRFFVDRDGATFALKEEPAQIAGREYDALRACEEAGLPAVRAVGIADARDRDEAILVTEYLRHSLQYRRLLARFDLGPGDDRDSLLDAMAGLLVDLHRAGVYWGDCSLANTLFRRDGDRIAAYLVDAETSEIHPSLSDGQRGSDLEVLVENVAFGLADLAARRGRLDMMDEAISAAEGVADRYRALWDELFSEDELRPDDRYAVAARVRRLNELGFAVDEISLSPAAPDGHLRLRVAVTTRAFHARELARRTGIAALENQARLLLNDLREYQAWIECAEGRTLSEAEGADRWLHDVLWPTLAAIDPVIGPRRDPLQAYCDVLETKWLLSERAGHDVGLAAAIDAYLAAGAPAPEGTTGSQSDVGLDNDADLDEPLVEA
jgi:tRNA A-37 threonylcarbamoyl transferase component Bud32